MVPCRLKQARLRNGLTQEKLGQLVYSNRSCVGNYETGNYAPPFSFIVRVARLLDYPEAYFYTEDSDFAEKILKLYVEQQHDILS